jgi:hypothetical protein
MQRPEVGFDQPRIDAAVEQFRKHRVVPHCVTTNQRDVSEVGGERLDRGTTDA